MKELTATVADDTWYYLRTQARRLACNERLIAKLECSDALYDLVDRHNPLHLLYVYKNPAATWSLGPEARNPGDLDGVPEPVLKEIVALSSLSVLLAGKKA